MAIVLLVGLVSGCGTNEDASVSGPETSLPPLSDAFAPVTIAEAEDFAKRIEQTVARRDAKAFDDMIAYDSILHRATEGFEVPTADREGFIKGALESSRAKGGLGTTIVNALGENGSFQLLRVRASDGQPKPLFRGLLRGALNYYEFTLMKDPSGNIRIVEIDMYAAGESITQTMRRLYYPVVANANRDMLQRIRGEKHDAIANTDKMIAMHKCLQNKEFTKAIEIYKSLPESLRREKVFLLGWMSAASEVNESEYLEAMNAFLQFHPNDVARDLVAIDRYFFRKEYSKAIACLNRIDRRVDGDPYLEFVRASVYLASGDVAAAKKHATAAEEKEPTLINAQWALVEISLREKDFQETARRLTRIKQDFRQDIADLHGIDTYAEFVKSPEYETWRKEHQPKK